MSSTYQNDKLAIKTQQGVGSTTWTRPPFYGEQTIPELFAFHSERSPEHPVIVYDDQQGAVRELRYKHVFPAIRKAAAIVSRIVRAPATSIDNAEKPPVIGVLAIADSVSLTTLFTGIMYLGYTVFPISVRNSAVAVAHLVRRTSVRNLLVSPDAGMQRIAREVKEQLEKEAYELNLLPLPTFHDLYESNENANVRMGTLRGDNPAMILHSSGSTAFPKPITLTHRSLTRWGFLSYFGDFDLCGVRFSLHSVPMFHTMGAVGIPWVVCTGVVLSYFRPSSPPTIATPDTVLRAAIATQCSMTVCVPSMIEAWSRDPESVDVLRKLKALFYAGAPLNKEVAEYLLDQGVNVATGYGTTEIGFSSKILPDASKIPHCDWEYFSLSPPVEFIRIYQTGLPRVFEPVIVDCPTWSPNAFNTEVNGRPAYATSDLLEEHPTNPDLYRVYGRADDQIMLSTGEKTNPVPLESILLQDPNIFAAIIFGRGRLQNGVIIQPKQPFDPSDEAKLEEFRNKIWPTVERANNFAPSHSRIFKEMITVTKPEKPFLYTAKGTPRRHVSLAEYAEEIEELYQKVEETSQVDVQIPSAWTPESAHDYVVGVVQKVVKVSNIRDEDDLFQHGCDSLQATWIRNTILHAVRTTSIVSTHDVPSNFVYLHPTIGALSKFLHGLVSGKVVDKEGARAERLTQMEALVAKYTGKWPTPQWRTDGNGSVNTTTYRTAEETYLLTGTTGRLGSHLLAQLLQKPEVAHVYALNRESTGDPANLEARQREAFKTWKLDSNLLSGGKVLFHPADLSKRSFGVGHATYEEMRSSVTAIVHNAWRVDFNVALQSFEPLIAGARNLVDFALSSPLAGGPRLLFVSSISAALNHDATIAVPESLDIGPELAVGQGYGESKWVTEQILGRAARETGLRTTSVRVGQLSGDTRAGGWNTTEWVPAIVRVGKRIGSIPVINDTVSWVPVDIAASALLEMLNGGEPVLHLTSPRPASWAAVFGPIAELLNVPLVPAAEWLAKLRAAAEEAGKGSTVEDHDSAFNLIPFFELMMRGEEVKFDTQKAVRVSHALADLGPLGKEDVVEWLRFWQGVGFVAV